MILAILIVIALLAALTSGGLATTAAALQLDGWDTQHRHLATAMATAALLLLVVIAVRHLRLRKLSAALGAGIAAQAILQGGFGHALLAHMLVAGSVALCVALSESWTREPQYIQDYGWPSLRSLAFLLPGLIVIQIALGAGFRHQLLSLIPHVVAAMLVAMFILMVGSFVLQQCKQHHTLMRSGRIMLWMTAIQVFLGIAAFTLRAMPKADANAILVLSTAHTATGSLLLASSIVLGMHIRRNVTPKAGG
jgi:hypothetical protein